jgi:hypothetical protein
MKAKIPIFLLCVVMCGCRSRLGDFTVITTKNIDLSNFSTHSDMTREPVVGEDEQYIICIIPTGIPNVEEAIDKALEKGKGQMLVDAALYYEWFYFPYIYGYGKYEIKGTPVKRID